MAISYTVGTAGSTAKGSGVLTPGLPTYAAGDLLLLFASARTSTENSDTDPSGWTLLYTSATATADEVWGLIAVGGESAPSIGFNGTSQGLAYILPVACANGWPAIGSILMHSSDGNNTVTGVRYRSLIITTADCLAIQSATKVLAAGVTNPPTAVATTAGYTQSFFDKITASNTGELMSSQYQVQTTATNLATNSEVVTGNTESVACRGISIAIKGNAAAVAGPAPGAAALSLSGQTVTVLKYQTTLPAVGALSFAGLAPSTTPGALAPGVATLTLAGLLPVVVQQTGPNAGVGVSILTMAGLAPSLLASRTIAPSLMTGVSNDNVLTPTVLTEWTTKPGTAGLSISSLLIGNLIKDGTVRAAPGVGLITMGSLAVTTSLPFDGNLAPTRGQIDLLGLAPSLTQNWIVAPQSEPEGLDILLLQGLAPTLRGRLAWHDMPVATSGTWQTE